MVNSEVKMKLYELKATRGIRQYTIARRMGIDPSTLSDWLAVELTAEKKERILDAVNSYKEEEN